MPPRSGASVEWRGGKPSPEKVAWARLCVAEALACRDTWPRSSSAGAVVPAAMPASRPASRPASKPRSGGCGDSSGSREIEESTDSSRCTASTVVGASGRARPASAPYMSRRQASSTGVAASSRPTRPASAPFVHLVPRGGAGPAVRELRKRAGAPGPAGAVGAVLQDALREERSRPRPWFERHHHSFGPVRNPSTRSELREYFGVPRSEVDEFAEELLCASNTSFATGESSLAALEEHLSRIEVGGSLPSLLAPPAASEGISGLVASWAAALPLRSEGEAPRSSAEEAREKSRLAAELCASAYARQCPPTGKPDLSPTPPTGSGEAGGEEQKSFGPGWDERFGVRLSKDNCRLHAQQREFFDAPSPRWARIRGQRWRGLRRRSRKSAVAMSATVADPATSAQVGGGGAGLATAAPAVGQEPC